MGAADQGRRWGRVTGVPLLPPLHNQPAGDIASVTSMVTRAHAVVVCTEWDEFTTLDYHRIYQGMEKPVFVFDRRLILDHQKLLDIGFQVEAIGKVVMATATPTNAH